MDAKQEFFIEVCFCFLYLFWWFFDLFLHTKVEGKEQGVRSKEHRARSLHAHMHVCERDVAGVRWVKDEKDELRSKTSDE